MFSTYLGFGKFIIELHLYIFKAIQLQIYNNKRARIVYNLRYGGTTSKEVQMYNL